MKRSYYLFLLFISISVANVLAQRSQNTLNDYEAVRTELTQWDAVRGPWLATSMEAMTERRPIPSRPFHENFTPHQMLRMVPLDTRRNIINYSSAPERIVEDQQFWSSIRRYLSAPGCGNSSGRAYGDPHLVSFDGARYSFQTVGEFVLAKSNSGDMEVQTRQKPQKEDFSLNTAVAMNVAGDRVCIYASDYPDGNYSTPVRLNGEAVNLNGSTYFLNNGGTIKKSKDTYTIYWPTGETVTAQESRSGNMSFLNVSVNIIPCSSGEYSGLLGNANGSVRDDFNTSGMVAPVRLGNDPFGDASYMDRERQAYLSKQYADVHRIEQENSLFDYLNGRNTLSYTDRSFPRVYHNFDDLSQNRIDRSRKYCEKNGIGARDMQGCIYDNAYLNIEPINEPIIEDPVVGTVLRPVTEPVTNVNPPKPVAPESRPEIRDGGEKPSQRDIDEPSKEQTSEPVRAEPEREISKPTPAPRPRPIRTAPEPRPKPTPAPRPAPTPKPTVKPAPSAPKGGIVKPRG